MATERSSKAITPPKGRPTPSRSGRRRRRTFGSTFQWAALAVAAIVLFVIALILLDGGDFNPFNDDSVAPSGQPVAADVDGAGALVGGAG